MLIFERDVATDPRVHKKELQKNLHHAKRSREERSGSGPLDPEGHMVDIHVFRRKG
jgi:hypothetical protein